MQMSYRKLKRCDGSRCHGSPGQRNPFHCVGGCQASNFLGSSFPCQPVQSRSNRGGQGGGGRGSQFSSWCFQNTGFWFLSSPLALLFISFKQPLEILGWGEGLCWRQEGPVFLPVCEMVAVWFLSLKTQYLEC